MMLSEGSRTRTVSRSMNCDWVDVASHLSMPLAAAMIVVLYSMFDLELLCFRCTYLLFTFSFSHQ